MKKEIKHSCPEKMVYSNKAGKCINPRLEDESLRFPTTKGRGKKGSGTHHS